MSDTPRTDAISKSYAFERMPSISDVDEYEALCATLEHELNAAISLLRDVRSDYAHPWPGETEGDTEHREHMHEKMSKIIDDNDAAIAKL